MIATQPIPDSSNLEKGNGVPCEPVPSQLQVLFDMFNFSPPPPLSSPGALTGAEE